MACLKLRAKGPFVCQQLTPLKQFDGFYLVIGSWVIDGESAGIGITEENSIVTKKIPVDLYPTS
jgi:glutathionylspermidine synthase